MIGLGTLINCACIIAGSIVGMLWGSRLKDNMKNMLTQASGVAVIFIGVSGALAKMLVVGENGIETAGTQLLIFSLVIGGCLGELTNIEGNIERFGEWLKKVSKREKDNRFVEGFVTSSLVVCVGAMAIVGAIEDGISGDYSVLLTKGILDFVIIIVFASVYGFGAMFSAVPVFLLQGSVTLLATFIEPVLTEGMISNISFVGSVLIFCVGINVTFGKKIKVANLLPALLVAIGYEVVQELF